MADGVVLNDRKFLLAAIDDRIEDMTRFEPADNILGGGLMSGRRLQCNGCFKVDTGYLMR